MKAYQKMAKHQQAPDLQGPQEVQQLHHRAGSSSPRSLADHLSAIQEHSPQNGQRHLWSVGSSLSHQTELSSLVAKFMVSFNLYRACREIKSGALALTAAARIVPDLVPKTTSILTANLMVSCSPLP